MQRRAVREPAARPKLWGSSRLAISFCVFLASVQTSLLRENLGMALLCMSRPTGNMTCDESNATMPSLPWFPHKHNCEFDWDGVTRGRLLGAFLYGYISTTMLSGYMANRYGSKMPFMCGGIGNIVFHLMCPTAAEVHTELFFACRFLQGMFLGITTGPYFQLFRSWATEEDSLVLLSFAFSGFSFGTILSYPLSGQLCTTNINGFGGWPLIYYVPALISILFVLYWCRYLYNEPESHPNIAHEEYIYLLENVDISDEPSTIPWKSMFTSMPLIAYTIFFITYLWNIFTVMNNMPLFLQTMLAINSKECGYLFSIPFALTFIVRIFNGKMYPIVKNYLGVSHTVCRKLYCTFGSMMVITSFLTIIYTQEVTKWHIIAVLSINLALGDFAYSGGFFPTLLDIAPNYSGLLSGITSFIGFAAACPATFVNSMIIKQNTKEEWNLVLWIVIAMFTLALVFYLVFGSASLQKWSVGPQTTETMSPSPSLLTQSYGKSRNLSLLHGSNIY